MTSYKGVVAVTKHGQLPPDDVLQRLLKNNQSCFGMAMVAELEGKKIVSLQRQPSSKLGIDKFARLKGVLEKYKNQRVVLFCGEFPEGHSSDDMQPFPVLFNEVSGGRPTLVASLVGDFNGKGTDGHSEQWSEINEYLTPKLLPIYEAVGYDIAKFMAKIKEAPVRKEIEGYFDRATLTLLSADDTCVTFGKEDFKGTEQPWGWLSPEYYAKAELVAEPAKGPAKTDLDDEFSDEPKVGKTPVVPPNKSQIGAATPSGATRPVASITPITGPVNKSDPPGHVMQAPPKNLSNKKIKAWYNQRIGKVPEDWKDCPEVPVKVGIRSFADIGPALETADVSVKKDINTHVVGKERDNTKVPLAKEQHEMQSTPLVPDAKQHAAFLDKFMKDVTVGKVDRNNETIFDPALLPSLEQDNPTFAELAKLPNIESAFTWKRDRRLKMIKEYPDMAEAMLFDSICENVEGWRTIQRLNKQITALKGGAAPTDVEEVVHERPRQPATKQGEKRKSKYAA